MEMSDGNNYRQIGSYPTLDDAKKSAQIHFGETR